VSAPTILSLGAGVQSTALALMSGDHGYGRFWDASARCNRLAHRVALGFRQALSDEMQVDHLCRNRICVRPDHLEEVTQQENIRRALPFRVTR